MFKVDDVVFARLEGYPFWPARVIAPEPQHLANLDMQTIPPTQRVVLFYNDDGRYAAMDTADLRNFDDLRIQRRTRDYDGNYREPLRAAFKQALQEHSQNHPSPTNSPHQKKKQRSTKTPPSQLTSPVTGHSESRQPKNINKPSSNNNPHPPTSPSHSPPRPPRREIPTTHKMASHTQPDASPTNPPSVQLRLPLKRNSALLKPSSQSTQPPPDKSVSKRRRLTKSSHSTPPQHSEEHPHPQPPSHHNNQTAQTHQRRHKHNSEKLTTNSNRRPRSSDGPDRIPRLTNRKTPHHPHEKRQRRPEATPTPPKSRLERKESSDYGFEEIVVLDGSQQNSDRVPRTKKRKRSSKDATHLSDDSDSGSEPPRKERRPASKRSLSVERPHGSLELQPGPVANGDVKGDRPENVVENHTSIESEQKTKPHTGLTDRLTAFDHLTKGECIDLIHHLQETVRGNNVELWRRGIRLAEEKDILKTDKDLTEACNGAVQKAENVFKLMKSEKKDKKEIEEKEAQACKACRALLDIYFDLDKMNMKVLPNRILELVEEMKSYSAKVSRVLLDVVVLWADLIGEKVRTESGDRVKRNVEGKQRSAEKNESKPEKWLSPRKVKTEKESSPKKVNKITIRSAPKKERDKTGMRSVSRKEDDTMGKRSSHIKEEDKIAKRDAQKKDDGSDQGSGKRTTVKTEKGSGLRMKDESTEKGSTERKNSLTREERVKKFDRKSCCNAMESLFAQVGKQLNLDEKAASGITKRVEREIRPKFEHDKEGYYDSSANVIKGLRKALKHLAVKGDKDEDTKATSYALGAHGVSAHASLLMDAIKQHDREKAKVLVSQLKGRR